MSSAYTAAGSTVTRTAPVPVPSGVQTVAAGNTHTLALKTDGTLWAWGGNDFGQLGDGSQVNHSTPVQVLSGVQAMSAGYYHTLALKTDGTVWAWGDGSNGVTGPWASGIVQAVPKRYELVSNVVAIASGTRHAIAVAADGRALGWGDNSNGQLGIPRLFSSATPLLVRDPLGP